MDQQHMPSLTRSLTSVPSRRDVLRGLAATGLGLGGLPLLEAANAAKKRRPKKKRKPKVRFNAFGCVNVRGFCKLANQCCSGICEGEPGKKTCRDHDTGGCPSGNRDISSCAVPSVPILRCTTSTGDPDGECGVTTGNAGYCLYSGGCYPCTKDAECQAICGPKAACTRCDDCEETGGTSCSHPDNGGCP